MNKQAKINILFSLFSLLAILIFFSIRANSFDQGNSFLNVSYEITEIAGRMYTPECLTDCHLPIKLKYDGSLPLPFVNFISGDLHYLFRNQTRFPESIKIEFLNRTNINVTDYSLQCYPYLFSNETGLFNQQNCSNIINGSHIEEIYSWARLPVVFRLEKNKEYYFDFVGKFNASLGNKNVDIVPSLRINSINFDMRELAWWNTSYNFSKNIIINENRDLQLLNFPFILNATNVSRNSLGTFAIVYNDSSEIPCQFMENSSITMEIWCNSTIELDNVPDNLLKIYYRKTGTGLPLYSPQGVWSGYFNQSTRDFVLHLNDTLATDSLGRWNWTSINSPTVNNTCIFGSCLQKTNSDGGINGVSLASNITGFFDNSVYGNATLLFWAYIDKQGTTYYLGGSGITSVSTNWILSIIGGIPRLYVSTRQQDGVNNITAGWHFMSMRWNASQTDFLIDMVRETNISLGGPSNANQPDYLMSTYHNSIQGNQNLTMDEVRFVGRYLSNDELNQTYQQGRKNWAVINVTEISNMINVSLVNPSNGFAQNNSVVSFNASLTPLFNNNITNATLYVWLGNGTEFNVTLNTSIGGSSVERNVTWSVNNFTDSNFTWNVLGCGNNSIGDSTCSWAVNRFFFNISIPPTITIISPTGTLSSRTFDVRISVVNYSALSYCYFNITRGASLETANTEITNCQSTSVTVSSDASYTVNVFANTTFRGLNVSSNNFTVSTGGGGGGGGGGGITVFSPTGEQLWTMTTETGSGKYELRMTQFSSRTRRIIFENKADKSLTLRLTTDGNLSNQIQLKQNQVTLPLAREIKTSVDFDIFIPEDFKEGTYLSNIIATDEESNFGILTIEVKVGDLSLPIEFLERLKSSRPFGNIKIPYILIFIVPFVIISIGLYTAGLRKVSFGLFLSVMIGFSVGVFVTIL